MAAISESIETVELLLAAGADPNGRIKQSGATPLELSCKAEISAALLRAGADPNARDDHGLTALFHQGHHIDVARVLLEAGADPNIVSGMGWSSLLNAIQSKDEALARLLLKHRADPNLLSESVMMYRDKKSVPLVAAIESGLPTPFIEALLDAGAEKDNSAGYQETTPLMAACMWARIDVMRLLKARGADKYKSSGDGWWTPAVHAGFDHSGVASFELRSWYLADAGSFCRGTHARLGKNSPVRLLLGFPEILKWVVDWAVPIKGHKPRPELP